MIANVRIHVTTDDGHIFIFHEAGQAYISFTGNENNELYQLLSCSQLTKGLGIRGTYKKNGLKIDFDIKSPVSEITII